MAKYKAVSITAILKCSRVSVTTTFVKQENIVKVGDIELATSDCVEIEPFGEDCEKGGCLGFGGKPCIPALEEWPLAAHNKTINGKALLTEISKTNCTTKSGTITIEDTMQTIVVIDPDALLILEAIKRLQDLLDERLRQSQMI